MSDHAVDTKRRICIGYGATMNRCKNIAGTPWTKLWCPSCDRIRRATITKQLEAMVKVNG